MWADSEGFVEYFLAINCKELFPNLVSVRVIALAHEKAHCSACIFIGSLAKQAFLAEIVPQEEQASVDVNADE